MRRVRLVKAINQAKLVKKKVQVRGEGGTYMAYRWVDPRTGLPAGQKPTAPKEGQGQAAAPPQARAAARVNAKREARKQGVSSNAGVDQQARHEFWKEQGLASTSKPKESGPRAGENFDSWKKRKMVEAGGGQPGSKTQARMAQAGAAGATERAEPVVSTGLPPTPYEAFLQKAEMKKVRPLGGAKGEHRGINMTFRAEMALPGADKLRPVIFKPASGETQGTPNAWRNEVAAFALDRVLGFGLTPTTVAKNDAKMGWGSAQEWKDVPDDLCMREVMDDVKMGKRPELAKSFATMALFDWLLFNTDRHHGNMLLDTSGKLWAIDHGYTLDGDTHYAHDFASRALEVTSRFNDKDMAKLTPERVRMAAQAMLKVGLSRNAVRAFARRAAVAIRVHKDGRSAKEVLSEYWRFKPDQEDANYPDPEYLHSSKLHGRKSPAPQRGAASGWPQPDRSEEKW